MTLRMADGPVANLPAGMNAYGGYVNRSGIGITYPGVVALAAAQKARAFSFTTDGAPADCADVESGAMSSWAFYTYGYCSVSNVNALIAKYGRPRKLLTAHQDPKFGAHICSPACWPGLVTTADGTQWIDHGGWDESLLADDFFQLDPAPSTSTEGILDLMATDNAFAVRYLYRVCLHREVDAAAFTNDVNFLNGGGTLNQLMTNIQDSAEGQAVIAAERKSLGLA